MAQRKELLHSRPNGWRLCLVLFREDDTATYEDHINDGDSVYVVFGPHDDTRDAEDGAEFVTFDEAKTFYQAEFDRLAKEPNWEAQARYDDANGTINGYAPWQYNQER